MKDKRLVNNKVIHPNLENQDDSKVSGQLHSDCEIDPRDDCDDDKGRLAISCSAGEFRRRDVAVAI